MNPLQQFQLLLTNKASNTKMFLTRQQIIDKVKKEKELQQIQNNRIQNKKISKPQSVMKVSIAKSSTQKLTQQKKTFSCSKFQINELVPDYELICKNTNKTQQNSQSTLNTDYFNFVNTKSKAIKDIQDRKDEFQQSEINSSQVLQGLGQYQQMKNELLKSFLDIEQMLLRKSH
ncbi:unnamed protein product (macronuclear) [Paramecium tetraurelia]|uniref:Uncharacterized protein n=1 Tax=Paramecium tetraurelia TaxID=5888 RepID=A0CRD3_PARTE|nr:uncharacterized protein GSPATT00009665001 [Paramecium tetraurelia]CAK73350.1 unnamed protein product [Paramecium tetraurelia]|eukprot:XP_001440747.1 hypothetical protein (macronuclear) [Paramecium tetraurelia strain d4-2]